MKKNRILALLLALAMMISLLAGCADSGNADKPTQPTPDTSTNQPANDKEPTLDVEEESGIAVSSEPWFRGGYTVYVADNGEASAKKTPDDTIVYANSGQIAAVDPSNGNQEEYNWSHQVYDTLLARDLTGETDFLPALATEWGYDDAGNFNITLREGVKFHDGSALDADDIFFTFERIANSKINKCASTMKSIDFEKSYKTDALHLTLVFVHPVGNLLSDLASGYCGIMSKEYFDANPEATLLDSDAGSGPYKLVETVSGTSQTFEAFADYWGGEPEVKTVIYKIYKDYSVMAIDFMNGDLDVCFNNNFNTVTQFLNGEIENATLYQVPSRSIYLDLTTRGESALSDSRLRQALAHCIDYEALVSGVYQDTVMASATTSPFPPGTKYEKDLGVLEYDPELAISLLAECGYSASNPCKLKMLSTNNAYNNAAAEIIQQYASLVGFDIELTVLDSMGANAIKASPELPAEYDMFVCSNSYNTGAPESFMAGREMFSAPDSTPAIGGIDDVELNELAQKAAYSVDEAEREQLYAELQEMFYEECWTINLLTNNSMVLAQNYVGELEFLSGYAMRYSSLSIVE